MNCLIIIPAYNEEESIGKVIRGLRAECPDYDLLVVNDGSTDSTARIVEELGTECISLPFNEGLSGAFRTGMKYALKHGYQYALQFDADGQHLPVYVEPLHRKAEEEQFDIVIGSRFLNTSQPLNMRRIGAAMVRRAIKLTTGKNISDPTSGLRIYNRKMIRLFAERINFVPEPDTVAYLIRSGARVGETEVEMAERTTGTSYLTAWKSMSYMIRTVLSILLLQYSRPLLKETKEKEAIG